jgi:hypothetical protein
MLALDLLFLEPAAPPLVDTAQPDRILDYHVPMVRCVWVCVCGVIADPHKSEAHPNLDLLSAHFLSRSTTWIATPRTPSGCNGPSSSARERGRGAAAA